MRTAAERFDAEAAQLANVNGPPLVKVVASDTGEPVPDIFVGLTLIGPDGGDGGYQLFLTQADGIAVRHHGMAPGRYQHDLRPHPDSRYMHTEWKRSDPYVVIAEDGTTSVPVLILDVRG